MNKKQQFFNEFFSQIIEISKQHQDVAVAVAFMLDGSASIRNSKENNDFAISWGIHNLSLKDSMYISLTKQAGEWILYYKTSYKLYFSQNYDFEDVKASLLRLGQFIHPTDSIEDIMAKSIKLQYDYVTMSNDWSFKLKIIFLFWTLIQDYHLGIVLRTQTQSFIASLIKDDMPDYSIESDNNVIDVFYKLDLPHKDRFALSFDVNRKTIYYKSDKGTLSPLNVFSFEPLAPKVAFTRTDVLQFIQKREVKKLWKI